MKLYNNKGRRRSRQRLSFSKLIFWAFVVGFACTLFTPLDSSPTTTRVATEARLQATAASAAVSAKATATDRATVVSATPKLQATGSERTTNATVASAAVSAKATAVVGETAEKTVSAQKSDVSGCYRHSQAWLSGEMNIRQQPSTAARILGSTPLGERYDVVASRQGEVYCWLDIQVGWIAQTDFISATKPQAPLVTATPVATRATSNNAVQQALDALQSLNIAPEKRCSPYDSDDYPHSQSLESQIVARMGGRIYGPYTGTLFISTRETDIEHIVAKSEAHDSGLCAADAQTRKSFARDLLNLTLASPSVNRHQKSGKDFAEWTPARNKCWYADMIIKVKTKYQLSVDSREQAALEQVLRSCPSVNMAM